MKDEPSQKEFVIICIMAAVICCVILLVLCSGWIFPTTWPW
jgi:hypothetical protein